MTEELIIGIAEVIVLGIAAQWLAWRFRLPSILLLLIFGFVAGPVLHFLNPDELLGELVFPIVSLSVAIILFEGGLSLKISELRQTAHVVRNLITVGVLITWLLSTILAFYVLSFELPLAILFGAILTVTGPTVIVPLLKHVRAIGQISSIVKWEGIVNDPIGAILAVLVFEGILAAELPQATTVVIISLAETVLIGLVLGGGIAWVLAQCLRRYWIPDYLQSGVSLMLAIAAFAASNALQKESGLATVTLMGVILTNQKGVNLKPIIEFKENLNVLLLSALFIILAARLDLATMAEVGPASLMFLTLLVLVVRPVSVLVSTFRSGLRWQEKVFIAWMAPRGIVAAAVTSIFAIELAEEAGYTQAEVMVPEMFLIIVGTVAVYGLTAAPLGRWLGVAQPNPQGILIAGAHRWARYVASALQGLGFEILMIDTNHDNIVAARLEGLPALHANILSEHIQDEVELGGFGRFLALTRNDEVNALATLHFAEAFGRAQVYQLSPAEEESELEELVPLPLRGRLLFAPEATCARLAKRMDNGATVETVKLTEQFNFNTFQELYGPSALPLFLVDENGNLSVFTTDENRPIPRVGQTLVGLVNGADPL